MLRMTVEVKTGFCAFTGLSFSREICLDYPKYEIRSNTLERWSQNAVMSKNKKNCSID